MSRITHARWPALIAAVALIAVGAPLAEGAGKAKTIHLKAPKSVKTYKSFTLKARGKTDVPQTLRVLWHPKGKCKKTAGAEESNPNAVLLIKDDVGPGKYSRKQGGIRFGYTHRKSRFCGYLNNVGDPPDTKANARASRKLKVHN